MLDVIIVGGGPAGLSAALILGRCRRRVVVFDSGRPRNSVSPAIHGFLTRDGCPPDEFRRIAGEQLARYPDVEFRQADVVDAMACDGGFRVIVAGGAEVVARKLLLATGVADDLPPVAGAEAFYGSGLYHCPYCDGWEYSDQPLAAYGRGAEGKGVALELVAWSRDIVLCSDGPADLADDDRESLRARGIRICEDQIAALEGTEVLQRIRLANGDVLPVRALFFFSSGRQASDLAERLGCELTDRGAVDTGRHECTNVPGVFVAGDASRNVQLAIIAAAEGAMAAFAINTELLKEGIGCERARRPPVAEGAG